MREMKYRAWNAHKNEWYDPALIKVSLDFSMIGLWCGSENGYVFSDIASWNIVIQQYTGLKDKNGVEIYEGDILRVTPPDAPSWCKPVYFEDAIYKFNTWPLYDFFKDNILVEVAGSIFENSELLEK